MGTEIQPKTYVPVYYPTRDLNSNAENGLLAVNHEDERMKNGMWFDSLLIRSGMEGYLGHDKEQMRQTIMKHESTFRHQLQELHRLYKRQWDLMNEIKRRELMKLPMPAKTSQIYIPSDYAKKPWHMSNLPFADSTFGGQSTSGTNSFQYPLNFTNGNNMSSSLTSQDQVISKDGRFLESRCDNFQKGMLIHGVPANLYMKNDEKQQEERVFGWSAVNTESTRERVVNLSVGDSDGSRGNLYRKRTLGMVDLNEPIQVEDVSVPSSVDNAKNIPCLEEAIQRLDLPVNSNSGFRFLSKECPRSSIVGTNGGICLNNLHSKNEGDQKEQFMYNFQAGRTKCDSISFHQVIGSEDSNTPFRSSKVEPKKVDEPLALLRTDQSKTEPRRTRKIFGVEIPEETHDQSVTASHTPKAHPLAPQNGVCLGSHLESKRPKICSLASGFNLESDVKSKSSWSDLSEPCVRMKYFEGLNSVDAKFEKVHTNVVIPQQKILGVPIFDMPQTSKDLPSPSSVSKSSGIASAVDGSPTMKNLAYDHKSDQVEVGNHISGLSRHIDLNLCSYEVEAPLAPSLPTTVLKIATTEIDLEAPAVLESELNSERIQLKEPHEDTVWVAAEALLAISSSNHQSEDSSLDSLRWFADVIFTHKDDLEGHKRTVSGESIPFGLDCFEYMTLNLTEAKEEDYCYDPPASENQKDTETGAALSPKRPRRGQARKGRQRKDFQKDVLPGLVSLSRHEVTDDLQIIEDLFRISGCTWQSSLSQRNAAKNGRGRRRSGAATVICQPPSEQPVFREVGLDEKSLTGWGKRTRRLPRQRCPADGPIIALKC